MEKVKLDGSGVGIQEFELSHAERILNNRTPPKVWKLADARYEFKTGKLTLKADGKPQPNSGSKPDNKA